MASKIYLAYHKPSPLVASQDLQPIHVGRSLSAVALPNMIGDDIGENISALNEKYCELTALYWAWKNDKTSDYIGLMHYRRLLDFAGEHTHRNAENFISECNIDTYTEKSERWIESELNTYDMILPVYHQMGRSVRENFLKGHKAEDLEATIEIVERDYPDYAWALHRVLDQNKILLANMFVMRADIMDTYCEWLFDLLGKVDRADIDRRYYNPYQSRYLGFLAERLFTVFILKYLADHPETKVRHLNILNLAKAFVYPQVNDNSLNGSSDVNIAIGSDQAYLPHAAAMIRSLAENGNPSRVYNIFYLHSDIGSQDLELFESVTEYFPYIHLTCVNVGDRFKGAYRSKTRSPSNATYNRFLLFQMFPTLDRLLYLDADMIVLGDVAEIYDWEMGVSQIAAVPDFIMTRTLTTQVKTRDESARDLYKYQRDVLKMSDVEIENYFNAGVILFNFKSMNLKKVSSELMSLAQRTKFLFRDQDILNVYFKGKYLKLPARFNVFNSRNSNYKNVPIQNWKAAMEARKDPFIVHFASGEFKPWDGSAVRFSHLYWKYLRETPFYGRVIVRAVLAAGEKKRRSRFHSGKLLEGEKLRALLSRFVPVQIKRLRRSLLR